MLTSEMFATPPKAFHLQRRLMLVGLLKSLRRHPLQFNITTIVTILEYLILLMLRLDKATIVMLVQTKVSDGFDVMSKLLLFHLIFDC